MGAGENHFRRRGKGSQNVGFGVKVSIKDEHLSSASLPTVGYYVVCQRKKKKNEEREKKKKAAMYKFCFGKLKSDKKIIF